MPDSARTRVMTFGTEQVEPPPRRLSAGPLSADLSEGALRGIRWHGVEVLRGINCPIRDVNWGTYLPENIEESVREEDGGFQVARRFTVAGGALACELAFLGRADGTLTADLSLRPQTDLRTNRAGFTMLHPLEGFVGAELRVEHSAGEERIRVPELIAPAQPVFDIVGLDYAVGGARVSVRFAGEVFEMEDQRNWTDASFKTYCRPLSKPWPYLLPAGETIRQRISLQLTGNPGKTLRPTEAARLDPQTMGEAFPAVALAIEQAWLPDEGRRDRLSALGVSTLQIRLARGGSGFLKEAGQLARDLGASYDLEIVVSDDIEDARRELASAARLCAELGIPPAGIIALPEAYLKSYQPDGVWPSGLSPRDAAEATRAAFPGTPVGGGVLTNFTELNRCRPDGMRPDFVTHGTSAIVHAADDRSVIETLEALPQVFASAEAIAAGAPYRLGLVSIGMRSNPYGAAVAENPDRIRKPMAGIDPRQHGLFGAAWAVGALAATEGRRVASIALAAPAGPFGLMIGDGRLPPLFHVVRAAAAMDGKPRASFGVLPDGLLAAGCLSGGASRLIVANLSSSPQELAFAADASARMLDAQSFEAASADPLWLDRAPAERTDAVVLQPFAIGFIDLAGMLA